MDGHGGSGTSHIASNACTKEEAAMDLYLRSQGLYRKRIAKDGSCLFRAVAEQVMHSQAQHLEIRKSCINYLRENRSQYEAFIEGPFEEYLKRLENPQEWVGEVEISALSLMLKRDFVIYQEPNVPPAYVTEHDFSEKILLYFSNGNHYDIIYPIGFVENASLCQSIVYELLYEKVLGVDVTKCVLKMDSCEMPTEEEVYDSDVSGSEGEVTGSENASFADMNGYKAHKAGKWPQKKDGDASVHQNVLRSLNPAVYRNVEYEVWLRSQKDQQKLDFSIAAGMQYSAGDKCQVRLEPGGKFYNCHIQEVSVENGPVVVFVEELGKKHNVQLKNLKPVSLTIGNTDGWSTVSGKKIKKGPGSGSSVQLVKDHRGQRGSSKPIKPQAASSPHPQQGAGNKGSSLQSSDQSAQCESKERSRTPPKVPGRKLERTEESCYFKRESVHFGLTPEERQERQVIEESRSLYELQSRDQDAFPALSAPSLDQTAVQCSEGFPAKKALNPNPEKSTKKTSEGEDHKQKASKLAQSTKEKDQKAAENVTETPATSDVASVLPSPAELPTPTTVPSASPAETEWSGIPAPTPAPYGAGPDSSVLQPQVTSPAFTQLPVSVPAVNQPLLPIPQALSAFQDPLYPGFPLNEKGESATLPPYSFCKTGEDLPMDKNILRFFFNLGLKAYTYNMWPPQSYLYPLQQAYVNMYRVYPNIQLYPQGHWIPEAPVAQSEVDPPVLIQRELRADDEHPQPATVPPTLVPALLETPEIAEQVPNQPGSKMKNQDGPQSGNFESVAKSMTPQPAFGQGAYMGTLPMAPSFFPHFWYGYPYQAYVENPVVQHNVFITSQDRVVPENISSGGAIENNLSVQGAVKQLVDSGSPTKPGVPPTLAGAIHNQTGSVISQEAQMITTSVPLTMAGQQDPPAKMIDNSATPMLTQAITSEAGSAVADCKVSAEKGLTMGSCQMNRLDEKSPRAREESSEDEREVSNMLNSGRSKNFYNQTYGVRRPRNEKFYQPGRGGYQHIRNEDAWRGQRGREDGYPHYRGFRGRPYRRRSMGENFRAQHE
ncbi:OTU domain-containing protein 4 [Spea bombifrons]|uniref:OTU domain-containing protein 4 n=1 Tax=Spea bombifrons TaxID=233779 RepID=UPI00234A1B2C|nr:OTU domain-containing protein 4 [Spea bombifrons]